MQSGLGLLTYQGQTGAVGHGEYFFFHFGASTSGIHASLLPFHPFTPTRLSPYFGAMSVSLFVYGVSIPPCRPFILLHLPTRLPFPPPADTDGNDAQSRGVRLFGQPTLDCAHFYDPGSHDVPFPYPPPNATLTACRSVRPRALLPMCTHPKQANGALAPSIN